jgi:CubicO group peptidase (beta-lactamase class C family)
MTATASDNTRPVVAKTTGGLWRRLQRMAGGLAAAALLAAAPAPDDLKPVGPAGPATAAATLATPAPGSPAATLTKADLDAWLDGYLPYALEAGDIAGAVVVVVKDGQVVTQRGFGFADVHARRPVDPASTMFRPGSISKLFTWTAVMQLVQAGKLDLDKDVNTYLDYKIPPRDGKPITLRNLMTHTAGFAEQAKYLITYDPGSLPNLEGALKRSVPERIYAPGAMAAYSNYGAALAGYIVQRVSGEPFDDYIARHIFAPLGMTHSSFKQPLPGNLQGYMSKGYGVASQDPQSFELIALSPAGALSASGTDMARFMMAHLANGGPLLSAQTTQLMHAPANTPIPGLPAMALGFYHEDRNGQTIVGHGGDTDEFHSDLHLYVDRGVGLYMSFNSAGKDGAAHVVRQKMFDYFTDRYFPAPDSTLPTQATAREHGEALSGHYVSSRASAFSFMRLVALLGETTVSVNDDGTISASSLTNAAGVVKRWREVGPWQWLEVGGRERLHAVVGNGEIKMFSISGYAPIIEFLPAPGSLNAGWIMPLMLAALAVLLVTALSWPILAMVRRHYGHTITQTAQSLRATRIVKATAWAALIVAVGWVAVFLAIINDGTTLDGRLDPWMRVLQVVALLFIAGAVFTAWHAVASLRGRGKWIPTIWLVLVAISAMFLAWLALDTGLITAALNY